MNRVLVVTAVLAWAGCGVQEATSGSAGDPDQGQTERRLNFWQNPTFRDFHEVVTKESGCVLFSFGTESDGTPKAAATCIREERFPSPIQIYPSPGADPTHQLLSEEGFDRGDWSFTGELEAPAGHYQPKAGTRIGARFMDHLLPKGSWHAGLCNNDGFCGTAVLFTGCDTELQSWGGISCKGRARVTWGGWVDSSTLRVAAQGIDWKRLGLQCWDDVLGMVANPINPNLVTASNASWGAGSDCPLVNGNAQLFYYDARRYQPRTPVAPFPALPAENNLPPEGDVTYFQTRPGGIHLAGHAFDWNFPGTPTEIHVHLTNVNTGVTTYGVTTTNAQGYYDTVQPMPTDGQYHVCVYALNRPNDGHHPQLFCGEALRNSSPVGQATVVASGGTGIQVSGWAVDQDTTAPLTLHVYLDGNVVEWVSTTEEHWYDWFMGPYFEYGPRHFFSRIYNAGAGTHTLCVWAINEGPGNHAQLGCGTVTLSGAIPEF